MKRTNIKKRPLADTILASLEPENKEYRELDGNGLYFRVQPSGKKSWQLRYKNELGKWTWIGLGSYPNISAQLARMKAFQIIQDKSMGIEYKTKSIAKIQRQEIEELKYKYLVKEWLNTRINNWGETTYDKAVKSINRHIIPAFGERNYLEIKPKEWFDFFQGLQRNLGIHTQVEKLTCYCRCAYDLAKFQNKIMFNPLEGITKHLDKYEKGNMKHIELKDLHLLLEKIKNYPKRDLAIGLELLIHMFPRPVELRYAKWNQFDFDEKIWIRPANIMKNRIPHAIPLSPYVIQLLEELKKMSCGSDFLFPSRKSLCEPITDNTLNMALNRMGYKYKQNPHGFRHIASTWLNDQYSDREQVVESALAHLKKGTKGIYDKGAHLEERKGFMQAWSDKIEVLCIN